MALPSPNIMYKLATRLATLIASYFDTNRIPPQDNDTIRNIVELRVEVGIERLRRRRTRVVIPTKEQLNAVKASIQYDTDHFHFAICGSSGSGKSTLINALRGIPNSSENAAPVGVTASTSTFIRTRYSDPIYDRIIWFDIPGAGTINFPVDEYFNNQGLFVFDFIVLVYDIRLTEIDVAILENCYYLEIPVFVVRSKADQHIQNLRNDGGRVHDRSYYRDKYIQETRADYNKEIAKFRDQRNEDDDFLDNRLYIVTSNILLGLSANDSLPENKRSHIIDENDLIFDMLEAATRRKEGREVEQNFKESRE